MIDRGTRARGAALAAAAVAAVWGFGLAAHAAPINYGDFVGSTVTYKQVTEDSLTDPGPLFGAPTLVGDSLDFNPLSFGATTTGGGVDLTDGQLLFGIWAQAGSFIEEVQLSEAGDYTLFGAGTVNTKASVGLSGTIDVIEIDGVAWGGAPINIPFSGAFAPSGGTYDLVNDPGIGVNWSGLVAVDIEQYLVDNSIPFVNGATKVTVNLDNTLVAASEMNTTAIISKKDFDGFSVTVIPEPSTGALLALGLTTLARRRRR